MASPSSNVDSAENLSRWRAMMTGSSQSATDTTPSATSSVPRAASTSLNGSDPGKLFLVRAWALLLIHPLQAALSLPDQLYPNVWSDPSTVPKLEVGLSLGVTVPVSPTLCWLREPLFISSKLYQYQGSGLIR